MELSVGLAPLTYNGGYKHLARFTSLQAVQNAQKSMRGSVLSNLDEMLRGERILSNSSTAQRSAMLKVIAST